MAEHQQSIKKYYYRGNVLVTIEEFIHHHHHDIDLTKPVQILKEYEPKEEGMDCMISNKGVVNGRIIKSTEIFDLSVSKQNIYKKSTEYFFESPEERYKIETIWDKSGKITSKMKITSTHLIYMI
jgi:hypothetical protein